MQAPYIILWLVRLSVRLSVTLQDG